MADTETAPTGDDTLTADAMTAPGAAADAAAAADLLHEGTITTSETGDLVSRDERHDSIDQHTGTLTAEATALRAERGINRAGEQPGDPEEPVE